MKTIQTVAILILLCLIASCASRKAAGDFTSILNKHWRLIEINGISVPGDLSKEPFITFTSTDHKISGNASCNHFFGSYTIGPGNQISISQVGSTRMACSNMSIEQQFLQALSLSGSFVVENNILTLKGENNNVLAKFQLTNEQ